MTDREQHVANPTRRRHRGTSANGEASEPDLQRLVTTLEQRLDGEARFDTGTRALYATDGSNYRQVPIGVVTPRHVDDVEVTVAACREAGVPILGRGAGTSLAGQSCNVGVVIDFSRHMNRVLDIDVHRRLARVQPGVVLDHLRMAAKAHGLTFGPDPSTHTHCTLGGMIGNNSCGVHSVMAGRTADNVESLEILTYDGQRMWVGSTSDEELDRICSGEDRRSDIYRGLRDLRDRYAGLITERYPDIPRRVSGYNLDELLPDNGFQVARALTGTESTCVLVLEAVVNLVPAPQATSLVILGYTDIIRAAADVTRVLEHAVTGLEGIDDLLIQYQHHSDMLQHLHEELPEGNAWLLVEVEGDSQEQAERRAEHLAEQLSGEDGRLPSAHVVHDESWAERIWLIRESGLAATARTPAQRDTWPGWEDAAVPPDRLSSYLEGLYELYDRYGYQASVYGHFGDGCVHSRVDFDLLTADGIAAFRSFVYDAAELTLQHGGSLSGEHGDGQARAELLPMMFGDELVRAFGEFKALWDPQGRMNPGKVVDPYRIDENLRLGTTYRPATPATEFAYPDDHGSLARAAQRCVGVGTCRKTHEGSMCPSYMVTFDERHSTRGRARLLFEMLRGEVITDGWRSDEVHEALDLCLSCKACVSECPVTVDMATYKAEFWSHYYRRRLRPLAHYSMGLLPVWAPLIARVPRLVNAVTQTPGLRRLASLAGGLEPRRPIPPFATRTFRRRMAERSGSPSGSRGEPDRGEVIVWADTFTDHLLPETGMSTVEVLEAAGFTVRVPDQRVCCGLPMLTLGMVGPARRRLQHLLEVWRPDIAAGTPIVGVEPSCLAVLRHDLGELLPNDHDAKRLAEQVVTVAELLEKRAPDWEPPQLNGHAVVQGHCHQRAVIGMDADIRLLQRSGLDVELLDSACCGLAGSFGFERGHHDVAMAAGERVLFPAVRQMGPSDALIANGFSCRTQISDGTGRQARHLSEVLGSGLGGR